MRTLSVMFLLLQLLPAQDLFRLRSQMVGEVTVDSAIIQARAVLALASVDTGVVSVGRLDLWAHDGIRGDRQQHSSDWLSASEANDYFLKCRIDGLKPNTRYSYAFEFGPDRDKQQRGATGQFRTLAPDSGRTVVIAVVTGMNYDHFHLGRGGKRKRSYQGTDKLLGYPALASIRDLAPDFFVGTGDNVYYDRLAKSTARDKSAMRAKWHEQFAQPRFVDLFARVPTYWEKDDHDYRLNDSDTTGNSLPSHEDGVALFKEQLPVTDPQDDAAVTYRTHRLTKHAQIWLLEGRDYRDPNSQAPGPEKSLWGATQKRWLKETLMASDARYKIIISPTPMVGPDDAYKSDNHVNPRGFRDEGEAFFAWLAAERSRGPSLDSSSGDSLQNVYLGCGDRHWQYHSVHPTGIEEFSCGALVDANARLGRRPGGSKSTDPEALIRQPYRQRKAGGGFLLVKITGGAQPRAQFIFYDTRGTEWYQVIR